MKKYDYDVAIVGASIAGCTAAALFARRGARVALLERHSDPSSYKVVCTHFIQPSATPTIERLGLAAPIEAAGGLRNGFELHTPWGWVRPVFPDDYPHPSYGYSIRRELLDPMLRELAAGTPGVDLMLGVSASELIRDGRRVSGVRARRRDGEPLHLRARLVVGADGRDSRVADLAGGRAKVRPHNRFGYFAYYRDLPVASAPSATLWFLDPEVRYAFPMDGDTTLMAAFVAKDRLPAFKQDLEESFARAFDDLPGGPDLSRGERISKVIGKLELPNVSRPAARPGLALIGDAALASDPVWGVGCGWAFQSAEWLVETAGEAVVSGAGVDRALARYRRRHRARLALHHLLIADYSTGRRFNPLERLILSAAVHDPRTALTFAEVGHRMVSPLRLASPLTLGHAAWVAGRARRRGAGSSRELSARPK